MELPFVGTEAIKEIARLIRSEIYGMEEAEIRMVKSDDLVRYLWWHFGFLVEFPDEEPAYTLPRKIWGLVDYENRRIIIFGVRTANLHLLKFSIAHEIAHLVLHRALLENGRDNFSCFYEGTKESKRMETQANMLASHIILGDIEFQREFKELAKSYYLNPNRGYYLYLDDQPCNRTQFIQITDRFVSAFDVSREQIKYRLMELGWLKGPGCHAGRALFPSCTSHAPKVK